MDAIWNTFNLLLNTTRLKEKVAVPTKKKALLQKSDVPRTQTQPTFQHLNPEIEDLGRVERFVIDVKFHDCYTITNLTHVNMIHKANKVYDWATNFLDELKRSLESHKGKIYHPEYLIKYIL